jgi:hypothetical protein
MITLILMFIVGSAAIFDWLYHFIYKIYNK